jgi:glycosyltransferase involved in cell wall biosynthesis
MNQPPVLAIVVPCYNEEAVLEETNKQLTDILKSLSDSSKISPDSIIVYVNDGSNDSTWDIISQYHEKYKCVHGIKLAHNSGHQNALMAGLESFVDSTDAIVTIDADLQDDVHAITEMVEAYLSGADIVYGVRKERKTDTFFKRSTALLFYRFMSFLGTETVYNHADYRLMSKRAVEALCKYSERNLFLRGLVPRIGYSVKKVYYDRAERFAGESKYPLGKMLAFAIDGVTSFSTKPISLIFILGCITFILGFSLICWTIISYISGNVVPGWTSILASLWFIGGVIITSLGIIGEYVGKIYVETKHRPRFNIETIL